MLSRLSSRALRGLRSRTLVRAFAIGAPSSSDPPRRGAADDPSQYGSPLGGSGGRGPTSSGAGRPLSARESPAAPAYRGSRLGRARTVIPPTDERAADSASPATSDLDTIAEVNSRAASSRIGAETESIPISGQGVVLARSHSGNLDVLPPDARRHAGAKHPELVGRARLTADASPDLEAMREVASRAASDSVGEGTEGIPVGAEGKVLEALYPSNPNAHARMAPKAPWSSRSGGE
jgi:hypothetical protein